MAAVGGSADKNAALNTLLTEVAGAYSGYINPGEVSGSIGSMYGVADYSGLLSSTATMGSVKRSSATYGNTYVVNIGYKTFTGDKAKTMVDALTNLGIYSNT